MTCPGELELARAITEGADPALAAHVTGCAACRATWDATIAMIELARELPAALPPAARREEMRTAVLAAAPRVARRPVRRAWQRPVIAAVAAAAAVVGYLALPGPPAAPEQTRRGRGTVHPHPGARYAAPAPGPDEIVRLADGAIDVEVDPLAPGERFRVVVGGAEVEVRGTAFTVTARAAHLTAVVVQRGRVEVRPEAGAAAILVAGQSWQSGLAAVAPAVPPTAIADVAPAASAPGAAAASAGAAAPSAGAAIASSTRGTASTAGASTARSALAVPAPRQDAPAPGAEPAAASRTAEEQAYDQAWQALRTDNFARAASGFARVLLLAPDSPLVEDAGFWRAVALARGKRSAEAITAFHDFLDGNPRSARAGEASTMLGWLLIDARGYDEAARRFQAAIGDASPEVRRSARGGLDALATRPR